jgi:sugar-specific transcriptional regulator TrmB
MTSVEASAGHDVRADEDGDGAVLDALGLTADEFAVYRSVVSLGEVDPVRLRTALELPATRVDDAIRRLAAAGLVRSTREARVQAVDPSVALRPRVARLTRTADAFGALAAELADAFHASRRRHDPVRLLEVISGVTAIRSTLEELQRQARTEMLWLCKAGPVAMASEENAEEFRALDRGVDYRVVYERSLLTEPGMMAGTAAGIERGEQARVLPAIPVRLAVADRTSAVLTLTTTLAPGQEPTAAIIHDSALIEVLVAFFEQLWERATPLERVSETELVHRDGWPLRLDPDDRYLLSLLVSGIPDKAIASQMGVSTRTVQRRVSTLMESMKGETRVELAYVVGRHRALS